MTVETGIPEFHGSLNILLDSRSGLNARVLNKSFRTPTKLKLILLDQLPPQEEKKNT